MVYLGRSALWLSLRACLFVWLLLVTTGTGYAEPVFTGTVKSVHGPVFVLRENKEITAVPGLRVNVDDTIHTGADASAGLILHDGTRLGLGPNSSLRVESFLFDPANGKLDLLVHVLKGLVAYASGKIAQLSPKSVRIETPVATIGLRGTKCAVLLGSGIAGTQ